MTTIVGYLSSWGIRFRLVGVTSFTALLAVSCLTFAVQMEGHEITTIEAVGTPQNLSPLQQALHECHGLQCGFCTPGIVMTFEAYLKETPDPSEAQIRETLSGNLCRCTGYQNIVKAIALAARRMREADQHAG